MAAKSKASHSHHIVPLPYYVATFTALLVLMALTIVASGIEIPSIGPISGNVLNNIVALGIATIKAVLVIMIFMGVKWSTSLTKLWVITGFVWLSLMSIILADYGTRRFEPVTSRPSFGNDHTPDAWGGGRETALPRDPLPADLGGQQPPKNERNMRPRQ